MVSQCNGLDLSSVCSFHVGKITCGLDIALIREITTPKNITTVPLSPPFIKGIVNIRGHIVTIVNLKQCLDGEEAEEAPHKAQAILVDYQNHLVGLLVDRVEDIIEVQNDCMEAPPAHLSGIHGRFIQAIYKKEDQIVAILNLNEILKTAQNSKPQAPSKHTDHVAKIGIEEV